jgi:hypothetical protein
MTNMKYWCGDAPDADGDSKKDFAYSTLAAAALEYE